MNCPTCVYTNLGQTYFKCADCVQNAATEVLNTHAETFKKLAASEQEEKRAVKYDEGKLEWHLLPEDALEEVLKVFQYGKDKYGDFNWLLEPGFDYTRLDNSGRRHGSKWRRGQDRDEESNLRELAHICANYLMLLTYELRGIGKDDRKKLSKK
jgi:hypothetical protein